MSNKPNGDSRRKFLKSTLIGISGITLASQLPAVMVAPQQEQPVPAIFNESEKQFLEAAVDRLIPPDERWPGATQAGVVEFIDRQMAGPWGRGDLLYRHGPFRQGTAQQGYQLEYTPAELFRRSILAINSYFTQQQTSFSRLSDEAKDAYLTSLEKGGINLDGVPSNVFFDDLLDITIQGFFADPMYGGNKNKVAWRMIGFPGAYADYYDLVDQHGVDFHREPLSISERNSPTSSVRNQMARK